MSKLTEDISYIRLAKFLVFERTEVKILHKGNKCKL